MCKINFLFCFKRSSTLHTTAEISRFKLKGWQPNKDGSMMIKSINLEGIVNIFLENKRLKQPNLTFTQWKSCGCYF